MEKKRIQLLKWEVITKRKEEGGHGIKSIRGMNLAFITKLDSRPQSYFYSVIEPSLFGLN